MPHWDSEGREEWVCQKGGHICTGKSIWVERDSKDAKRLGIREGNVCTDCFVVRSVSLQEHCSKESGFPIGSKELHDYINRHYGHE